MLRKWSAKLALPLGSSGESNGENVRVFGLFFYLFCVVSASTIGRTAADTLFLSRFDSSVLSLMYLPQAAALIFTGFLFQRFGSRVRLDKLMVMLIPALALLVALSRLGVGLDLTWVYPVIYVGYDVFNFLMIVVFWQFASSILDQRKAKKTIPIVGSGGIVGGILSGFGLKLILPLIGTANLIWVYAVLQLLALSAVLFLLRRAGADPAEIFALQSRADTGKGKERAKSGGKSPFKRRPAAEGGLFQGVPHLKHIAVLSATLVISLTFVDFQFKAILRETLQNDALAGFMGSFYGFSGLCALFIQLFVSGKLVSKFGVLTSLLVFPVALLAGSAGVLLMPVLAMALFAKGSDKVLGDTIYSSVNQLIMFPVSPQWRNRAKSFLDGVIRNGAKGLAAISLIALTPLIAPRDFSYLIIALLAVGIYAAVKIKAAYLKMLLSSLQTPGSDLQDAGLDLVDPQSRQLLAGALKSPDRQQVVYALNVLGRLDDFDLAPYLPELIRHPAAEAAVEALLHTERARPAGMEKELLALLSEEGVDERVRSQALIALSAYAQDGNLEVISSRLEEDKVELQAGAIAGLIKYYGIEGMFRAVGTLKGLIESGRDAERTAMALLFGRIGIREFYKPLIPLLQDASADVQRNALRSAERLTVPELVPYIVPMLLSSKTRAQAIEALTAYDEKTVVPLLEPYLDEQANALHVPKVFERLGSSSVVQILLKRYSSVNIDMREKLLEALEGLSVSGLTADSGKVAKLATEELERFSAFTGHLSWMGGFKGEEEFHVSAEQVRAAVFRRVFQLLGLVHGVQTIKAVYLGWLEGDARRQANAAEVVEQLLHGDLRTELVKWMMASRTVKAEAERSFKSKHLLWLYDNGDEGLREVIRYAAIDGGFAAEAGELRERLGVRGADEESLRERMLRIRMLGAVRLFAGFTGKDLLPVAGYLQEVVIPEGEYVFKDKDPGDSLYLIREGQAGVYRRGERIALRSQGDSIGQTALLTRRQRSASVRAETELRLLRLDSSGFYEAMFDRTELAIEMMKQLSRRLRAANERKAAAAAAEVAAGREDGVGAARQESATDRAADPAELAVQQTVAASAVDTKQAAGVEEGTQIHNQVILRRVLVLQKIDLFAHLSQDDFVRLAHRIEEVVYESGEAICRMDEHGDAMYGIIEGSIRVHCGDKHLAVLGVGQCFGEMAVIDSGPRSADCTAAERTVLLKLNQQQMYSICFQQIGVLKGMMKVLADRLRDAS